MINRCYNSNVSLLSILIKALILTQPLKTCAFITYKVSMRVPTWPNIIRTFYTISNYTVRTQTQYKALQPFTRATLLKSMPTIPFLGSLFSSSSSSTKNMSFPVEKSDDEWQAVLSKGVEFTPPYLFSGLFFVSYTDTAHRTVPRPPSKGYRSTLYWQI